MSPRTWRLGGSAAAVLLLVVAWFLAISPTLQSASALEEETASQEQASQELRSRISLLKKQSEELPAQEAILADIQRSMPPTAALPTLIRNLTTVAKRADVVVGSVTPGKPVPVEQPQPAASSGINPSNGSPSSADPSAASTAESAEESAAAAPDEPTVESMSVTVIACGKFTQLRKYLQELESMKRVMAVSSVSISRGSCAEGSPEDDLTATVGGHVFTLPTSSGQSEAAASSGDSTKGSDDE